MADLDVELESKLMERVKSLAVRHYGDSGPTSIRRVFETALEMRLLWIDRAKAVGAEVEEPVVDWQCGRTPATDPSKPEIGEWLFGRRTQS